MESEYLSVKEAATLVGVSYRTIYTHVYDGTMEGITRVGRAVRIHRPTMLTALHSGQLFRRKPVRERS